MDNFKNHKEDKDLFPYEYGASSYDHMRESIFALLRREELASSIRSIYKHMEENGVVFSSPGASFKRKFCNNLSQYMNYRIRYPRIGENLKKDDKLRQLLEPLAKILCTEKNILEEWKKKNPNGYAEYNYPGGKKYAGEWKDCKYHGQGILSLSGRVIYEGKWDNGKRHGQGTTMAKDDDHGYKGEWKDDKCHGQGIRIWEDGYTFEVKKYEGEWKNSQMHGQGILYWPDGAKWVGEFRDDKFWNGILYDKDGIIIGEKLDGEFKQKQS